MTRACTGCRCRYFVWWIPEQRIYSSPTEMQFIETHLNLDPHCYRCNKSLSEARRLVNVTEEPTVAS